MPKLIKKKKKKQMYKLIIDSSLDIALLIMAVIYMENIWKMN